jgi:tetratricopeptide (TPR) repeat protein
LRRTVSGTLAFSDAVAVPPGAYRLALAALRNGRTGTAEGPVTARMQRASSLRLGDLLIGATPGDDAEANVTWDRRVTGDRVVATLPIGLDQEGPPDLTITLEIAKGETSPAILSAPAPVLPGDGRARVAQATLDARVLPAGNYGARMSVAMGGKEVARLFAPFSLERGAPVDAASPRAAVPAPAGATPVRAGFRTQDVLAAAVLAPFLDELSSRASDASRAAIGQAKAGRFAEAAQSLPAADPNDPVRPFLLGLSLLSQNQLQPASDAFRESVRAAPDFLAGAFYIGACYAAGGRDAEAVNAWQMSLAGLDQYPVVYGLLGEALLRRGQPDRARAILAEAVARWPDDRASRLRLVRVELDGRRYDQALEDVDAGLARQAADTDLLFVGMQAIFERVSQGADARASDSLVRLKRYHDAYVAAGGPQQSLAAEWVAFVEKKASAGKHAA